MQTEKELPWAKGSHWANKKDCLENIPHDSSSSLAEVLYMRWIKWLRWSHFNSKLLALVLICLWFPNIIKAIAHWYDFSPPRCSCWIPSAPQRHQITRKDLSMLSLVCLLLSCLLIRSPMASHRKGKKQISKIKQQAKWVRWKALYTHIPIWIV